MLKMHFSQHFNFAVFLTRLRKYFLYIAKFQCSDSMRKLPVIFLLYINIIFKPFDMNVT